MKHSRRPLLMDCIAGEREAAEVARQIQAG
jgi:hypothetical protein